MRVLVLGNDGRAHALVWKLFSSSQADVICGPGNGGTALLAPLVDLDPLNAEEVARWAFEEQIDIIVPVDGSSLRAGLVDEVVAMHIGVLGPSRRSTSLEQSRLAAKEFLLRHKLPTPTGRTFTDLAKAEKYLAAQQLPVIIQGDHPDAGGGMFDERYAALDALRTLFNFHPFEGSNAGVLIEESVPGPRISFSAITDGHTALPLLPTRIYDRLEEDDRGEFAPGMGAHTGTSAYSRKLGEFLHRKLITPIVAALERENLPYWGILGIDCVITEKGPRIVALRSGLADLEAQVVLPRLENDLLPLIQATIARRLDQVEPLAWRNEASLAIALVGQGYPHHAASGLPIEGLTDLDEGVLVFHHETENPAGLRYNPATRRDPLSLFPFRMSGGPSLAITTRGGHVLSVVALAATLNGARGRAILNIERIRFNGCHYRGDIGRREFD